MQRQLEDWRKTIDCVAEKQQRLLDLQCQAVQYVHLHPDYVSLAASVHLKKTGRSGCGSSGQVEVDDGDEGDVRTDIQLDKDCPASVDFSVEALLSWAEVSASIPPPPSPPRATPGP